MIRDAIVGAALACVLFGVSGGVASAQVEPAPAGVEAAAAPAVPTPVAPPPSAAPAAAPPEVAPPPPAAAVAAPPPSPAPTSALPDAAAQHDTQSLLAEMEDPGALSATTADEPSPVQLYGFADLGYRHFFVAKNSPWFLFLNRYPSFFVGNLNTYLDARLSSRWRALFELRFTYLPDGAPLTDLADDTIERDSTRTADYTDFSRSKSLGSIVIERAQLEYSAFEFLSFKAGQWLTPYGIWNVDHGSPVIIGVSRPFIIGAALIPEHQVGVMADGSVSLGGDFELGYMLGLSNGRIDSAPAYEDLDANKALTARAAVTYRGFGRLTVGTSFFTGRHTEAVNQLVLTGTKPTSKERIDKQFDEVTYAFDLLWRYEGLHLQSEWIINDRSYTQRGRPPGPNGGLRPDKRNWGGYGLLGYRLPWFNLMPYAKAEYSPEPQSQDIGVADQVVIYTAGLNYRPLASIVFKLEYAYGYFPNGDPQTFAGSALHGLDFQLACSF